MMAGNAVRLECVNTERGSVLEENNQTPVAGVVSCVEEFMNNSEPSMAGDSSFCWSTSCSSFDDDRWQKELKMHENFMPSELKIEYYDVMILYSEDNRADAQKFCDHLKNDIKLKDDKSVKAILYNEFVPQAGSIFRLLEIAMERSTYIFFYITKEFCEDKWIELSREECLMEAIENEEKRWCVVPVNTVDPKDANFKIPLGVKSLKGIDYYYNDLFYQKGVHGLIQNRLHQRLEKEKQLQYKQIIWLQNYKRRLDTEMGKIESLENMGKMETQQEMEQKIKGKAVNEVELTGASQEYQGSTTYQGAENCNNGNHNNSTKSVDHPFQEGSTNLMEPASQGPSAYGNIPNMSLLDSQDSTMATGTMNPFNEDTRPLQVENPTGASHDETGLPDLDALGLNPSFDGMNLTSDGQSETSDTSRSPLSQKSRGKADAIAASMVLNIHHVENLQLGEKSTVIKFMQTDEKSKNDVDNSNTVTGDLVHNEHNVEDSQKPADLPIPDSRSVAELKDEPASVANQQGSRQSQDCMNLSSRNSHGVELGLLLKNETGAEEEEKQILGNSLKVDIKSWKEEEKVERCEPDVNKRDKYSHLGARPKDPQKKSVGKAPPSSLVSLTPSIRKCQDRDGGETDLNTVAAVTSNEIEVWTVQDTFPRLDTEPKTTKRDSTCGEKPQADVNQYQVTWRSAAPLLARAFPFVSLQDVMSSLSASTDDDTLAHDEVD